MQDLSCMPMHDPRGSEVRYLLEQWKCQEPDDYLTLSSWLLLTGDTKSATECLQQGVHVVEASASLFKLEEYNEWCTAFNEGFAYIGKLAGDPSLFAENRMGSVVELQEERLRFSTHPRLANDTKADDTSPGIDSSQDSSLGIGEHQYQQPEVQPGSYISHPISMFGANSEVYNEDMPPIDPYSHDEEYEEEEKQSPSPSSSPVSSGSPLLEMSRDPFKDRKPFPFSRLPSPPEMMVPNKPASIAINQRMKRNKNKKNNNTNNNKTTAKNKKKLGRPQKTKRGIFLSPLKLPRSVLVDNLYMQNAKELAKRNFEAPRYPIRHDIPVSYKLAYQTYY